LKTFFRFSVGPLEFYVPISSSQVVLIFAIGFGLFSLLMVREYFYEQAHPAHYGRIVAP
jgi:hypothetical protein